MAKIDAMLRMMTDKGVQRTLLVSDQPYQIFNDGKRIEGTVTSSQQLQQILEEIVPPALTAELASKNDFSFQYQSPSGVFTINVKTISGALQLTITPASASKPLTPLAPAPTPLAPPIPSTPPSLPAVPTSPAGAWAPAPPATPPPHLPTPSPSPYATNSYPPPVQPSPYSAPPGYQQPPASPTYQPAGYPQPYGPGPSHLSHRSKIAAALFAFFLPCLGIHRFYLGYTGMGIVYLVLSFVVGWFTCGLSIAGTYIWSIIEGIIILCGGMNDAEGRPLS